MKSEAVVIGASAGGLTTLQKILPQLPADFPLPLLIVQHRLPAFGNFLTFPLNEACQLTVKEAEDKEITMPGCVYVAPANYHLLVELDKTLSLSVDAKVSYARPSIDVLFETAAAAYRVGLIGVILTGANHDGTAGLKKIKQNGGITIAQDPATAEAEIMPLSAIKENVVDHILSPADIASFLINLV